MHPLAETLLNEPVIAAVKTDEALTAALASPCSAVFLLASTLLTVDGLVHRIHDAGKLAVVHIDLVDGLSSREIAVDSLNALCHPDGIISTRPTLIRRARHRGLLTVQRAFILDSLSLTSLSGQLEQGKPDFVEILPGIMPGSSPRSAPAHRCLSLQAACCGTKPTSWPPCAQVPPQFPPLRPPCGISEPEQDPS